MIQRFCMKSKRVYLYEGYLAIFPIEEVSETGFVKFPIEPPFHESRDRDTDNDDEKYRTSPSCSS